MKNIKSYSRNGQDKWIIELFDYKKNGFYVDVGAHNGITLSNTKFLEDGYNWSGICIEPNDDAFQELIKIRNKKNNVFINQCVWDQDDKEVEFIVQGMASGIKNKTTRWNEKRLLKSSAKIIVKKKTKSLLTILYKNKCPKKIDFLSIDIEGSEEKIINESLFQQYQICCIILEIYSDCFPEDSCDVTTIHNTLKKIGYKMVKKFGRGEYAYILEKLTGGVK